MGLLFTSYSLPQAHLDKRVWDRKSPHRKSSVPVYRTFVDSICLGQYAWTTNRQTKYCFVVLLEAHRSLGLMKRPAYAFRYPEKLGEMKDEGSGFPRKLFRIVLDHWESQIYDEGQPAQLLISSYMETDQSLDMYIVFHHTQSAEKYWQGGACKFRFDVSRRPGPR